jgi:hypothetical protein
LAPSFLAVLAPYRVGAEGEDGPLDVEEVVVGDGGAGWLVTTERGTDLFVVREAPGPWSLRLESGVEVTSDAELAAVRVEGTGGFALIARGTELIVDGAVRVSGAAADGVLVAEEAAP